MPQEISGGKDRWQTHIFGLLTISLIAVLTPGCDTRHGGSHTRYISETSSVQAWTDAEGVHLRSATSEFLMNSSGYVKASLRRDGTLLSLDDANGQSGQKISLNGRIIEDFALNLGQVVIKDANGKFGKLGTHVEVRAKSASTGLLET